MEFNAQKEHFIRKCDVNWTLQVPSYVRKVLGVDENNRTARVYLDKENKALVYKFE